MEHIFSSQIACFLACFGIVCRGGYCPLSTYVVLRLWAQSTIIVGLRHFPNYDS
jgi:hypothetical protein